MDSIDVVDGVEEAKGAKDRSLSNRRVVQIRHVLLPGQGGRVGAGKKLLAMCEFSEQAQTAGVVHNKVRDG